MKHLKVKMNRSININLKPNQVNIMVFNKSFLSAFDKVLVTGPQRSGTTIISKFIHSLLKDEYDLVDEKGFETHNETRFGGLVRNTKKRQVIQCPGMSHVIHDHWRKNVFVIWCHRNQIEVIRSQERINWTAKEQHKEKEKYYNRFEHLTDLTPPISQIKHHIWLTIQQHLIPPDHWLEFYYPDLAKIAPDIWVDQESRKKFKPKQTIEVDTEKILRQILKDGHISKPQFDKYFAKFVDFK